MNLLENWIDEKLMPYMTRKTINYGISSYGLKHIAESELGFYVANDTLKELLEERGVERVLVGKNAYYPLRRQWRNY